MSYRKILVPLVGSDRDKQVLAAAFTVAKTFGAHVAALFVRPEPSEALPYMGEGISGNVIQEVLDAATKAADAALADAKAALKTAADAAQIPIVDKPGMREEATAALRVVQGHFADVVENDARLSDLVIFGALAAEERVGLKEAFEATLLTEGRPALLVPKKRTPPETSEALAKAGIVLRYAEPF